MGNSNSTRKNDITQFDLNQLQDERIRFIHKERTKLNNAIMVFTFSPGYVSRSVRIQGSYFQIQHIKDEQFGDDNDWDFALSGESDPGFISPKNYLHRNIDVVGKVKNINISQNGRRYIIKIVLILENDNQEMEFNFPINNKPFRHTENFEIGIMNNTVN